MLQKTCTYLQISGENAAVNKENIVEQETQLKNITTDYE